MISRTRAKRLGLEAVGWVLAVAGVAALVLPGPGLLLLFAGMLILSQQYTWAERRLRPVEIAARRTAADSVQSWSRMVLTLFGVAWLAAMGVLWTVQPDPPGWWPLRDSWWLVGGWPTGVTLIASAALALVLFVYSYRRYRDVDDLESMIEAEADARSRKQDARHAD